MKIYSLDVLLSQFWASLLFLSGSNSCFLTCKQVSQEAGKVVWYSYLFKDFPQFIIMHKDFSIVNDAEIDVFLEFFCFFDDPTDVSDVISGPSAFSTSSLYFWIMYCWTSSWFMYCWSLAWRILSFILLAWEMSPIVQECDHSLALSFFGIGMKTYPFTVLWALPSFPNLLPCWVQHFNSIIYI